MSSTSWYSKMYRSQEAARERNRREQKRMDCDRHGPTFVAKYHLSNLDHERRMVQRELERIRKGIHKQPKFSERDASKGSDVNNNGGMKNGNRAVKDTPQKINAGHSKNENKLYEAMVFLQNNPSALVPIISAHGDSDAYLETLEKIAPAISDDQEPFVPSYLKDNVDKTEKSLLLDKYKVLLQRHSPVLRQNSPHLSRKHGRYAHAQMSPRERVASGELSGTIHRLTDSSRQDVSPLLNQHDKDSLGLGDHVDGRHTGEHTPLSSRSRRQPELHELANGGMENARENVNRRLRDGDSSTVDESNKKRDDNGPQATKAATLFPSYDPEYYNPDGTLRTQHAMPSFKERWIEAEKTRYVRTRDQREMDKELSIQEIFQDKK